MMVHPCVNFYRKYREHWLVITYIGPTLCGIITTKDIHNLSIWMIVPCVMIVSMEKLKMWDVTSKRVNVMKAVAMIRNIDGDDKEACEKHSYAIQDIHPGDELLCKYSNFVGDAYGSGDGTVEDENVGATELGLGWSVII